MRGKKKQKMFCRRKLFCEENDDDDMFDSKIDELVELKDDDRIIQELDIMNVREYGMSLIYIFMRSHKKVVEYLVNEKPNLV